MGNDPQAGIHEESAANMVGKAKKNEVEFQQTDFIKEIEGSIEE